MWQKETLPMHRRAERTDKTPDKDFLKKYKKMKKL